MLIQLDSTSATPLYAQLVASLRRAVSTGEVPVGDKLPSAGDLAQALDLFESSGVCLIHIRQIETESIPCCRPHHVEREGLRHLMGVLVYEIPSTSRLHT